MFYTILMICIPAAYLFAVGDQPNNNFHQPKPLPASSENLIATRIELEKILFNPDYTETTPSNTLVTPSTSNPPNNPHQILSFPRVRFTLYNPRPHPVDEPPKKISATELIPLNTEMNLREFMEQVSYLMHQSNPQLKNMGSRLAKPNTVHEIQMLEFLFVSSYFNPRNTLQHTIKFNRTDGSNPPIQQPPNFSAYLTNVRQDRAIHPDHVTALIEALQVKATPNKDEKILTTQMILILDQFITELGRETNRRFGVQNPLAFSQRSLRGNHSLQATVDFLKTVRFYFKDNLFNCLLLPESSCKPHLSSHREEEQDPDSDPDPSHLNHPNEFASAYSSSQSSVADTKAQTAHLQNTRLSLNRLWDQAYEKFPQSLHSFLLTGLLMAFQSRALSHERRHGSTQIAL